MIIGNLELLEGYQLLLLLLLLLSTLFIVNII